MLDQITTTFGGAFRQVLALAIIFTLSACASLPIQGPERSAVEKQSNVGDPYSVVLINVSRSTVDALKKGGPLTFGAEFPKGNPVNSDLLGPGDVLNASIWEADPNGCFPQGCRPTQATGLLGGRFGGWRLTSKAISRFPLLDGCTRRVAPSIVCLRASGMN